VCGPANLTVSIPIQEEEKKKKREGGLSEPNIGGLPREKKKKRKTGQQRRQISSCSPKLVAQLKKLERKKRREGFWKILVRGFYALL